MRVCLYLCQYICKDISMPKRKMVMRSIRVPEKLWEAAKAKADENELGISDVVRELLKGYIDDE